MIVIVKIQLPLVSTGCPMALIYNESRTIEKIVPVNDDLERRMDGQNKTYFQAYLEDGQLELISPAPWQNW